MRKILCKFLCLLLVITSAMFSAAISLENNLPSPRVAFDNKCHLSFTEDIRLMASPCKGIPTDSNLVAYWSMDQDYGSFVNDDSGNGNQGTAKGTTSVQGKHGNACYFDGQSSITFASSTLNFDSGFTLSAFIHLDPSSNSTIRTIARKGIMGLNAHYGIRATTSNKVEFILRDAPEPANSYILTSTASIPADEWVFIAVTFDALSKYSTIYINGYFNNKLYCENIGNITNDKIFAIGKASEINDQFFKGSIDDFRVYDRALTSSEVAALYILGNPASFNSYYGFRDAMSNNTMLIYIANGEDANESHVTCTEFFTGKKLTFQANNSATINIWTNLDQPWYTTGVWNSINHTTTLTLDAYSTAQIDWNHGVPPQALMFSVSSTTVGRKIIFSTLWEDNHSLIGGGYIFSTNNTGQWKNDSWSPFTSNPCWGNVTFVLNSNAAMVVGFREFANNSLNVWGDSGIYAITTMNESNAEFLPSPTPKASSTPNLHPTPIVTPNPTASAIPTSTPTASQYSAFTAEIVFAIACAVLIALLTVVAIAVKKDYLSIKLVNEEEKGEEGTQYDYNI